MARGEGEAQESGLKSHFVERVVKLPVVHVAWDYATSTYTHLKESSRLVNFTLTNAEKSVNFVAQRAKPVVRKFEKQIQAVDVLACKGLGTLEQKVPIITKAPDQIIGETRKLYSDAVSSRIEGLRNYSNGKVKSVADYGLQKAVDIFGSHLVQSVITSVDGAFVVTEHYLDIILPPVDGESQNDVQGDEQKKSVLSRVRHISSKLRHRAYKHLTQQIETVQERTLDVLVYPIILAQNAKEQLTAAQNYARSVLENLTREELEGAQRSALLKVARLGVIPLVVVYTTFVQKKSEATMEGSMSQDQVQSGPVGQTVTDGVYWVVGMLRLVPSMVVLYTYSLLTFFNSREARDKAQSIIYKEIHQNKEENNVCNSDREIQQERM